MNQRYRWLKLSLIAFTIAVAAIFVIVHIVNSGDPRSEQSTEPLQTFLTAVLLVMLLLGVIGLVIVIIKYAVKSGIKESGSSTIPEAKLNPRPPGFPVVQRIPEYSPPVDGPGKYCVEGVNRETKLDAMPHIQADSAANAQVKAELDGIVVTSVRKV